MLKSSASQETLISNLYCYSFGNTQTIVVVINNFSILVSKNTVVIYTELGLCSHLTPVTSFATIFVP